MLFPNLGFLAGSGVIKLGLAGRGRLDHFDFFDIRGMDRENSLNADAGRNLADRHRAIDGFAAASADNLAFEYLDALLFFAIRRNISDFLVDAYNIAGFEHRDLLELFFSKIFDMHSFGQY